MAGIVRIYGIFMILFLWQQSAVSQHVIAIDASSGEPVERVALFNQNKSVSTITDHFGKANIQSFAEHDSIYFQHPTYETVGFLKHELTYGDNQVRLVRRNIMLEEFVISATKARESRSETPFMVDVLEPEQLSTTGFQTGADILQSTGNVMVQKSQGGGGSPVLRGFEANKILLVIDGVRMNNAIYRSGHLQNAITIDQNILERVEVLFGPSSIIYGSDALGGVIHYYTRKPQLNEQQTGLFTQFSTATRGKVVHADFNAGGKKMANLTSLTFKDFGDIRTGNNRPSSWGDWGELNHYVTQISGMDSTLANPDPSVLKNTGYWQLDMLNKTLYSPSDWLDIILNLQVSTSSDIHRFDQLNDYRGNDLKYAEWYYGPQNRFMASAQGMFRNYNSIYTNGTFTFAFQRISEDRITRQFRVDDKLFQEEDVFVYSANLDFTKILEGGQRLYYGLEYSHNDVHSDARYENIRTGSIQPAPTRYPGGGSHTNAFSIYGNYKNTLSEKMVLSGGLRYHYGLLRSRFTDANLPYEEIRINKGALTGSASLVYTPTASWQYNFILSTGFRNPNVDDYGKVRAKGEFVTVPNDELKPEYSYNAEIGISKAIPGIARFSGSVYFTYLTNAIVRTDYSINGLDSMEYDGVYYKMITNSNASLATIQGLSFRMNSDLNSNFHFMGTFNYLKGNDITNEVPLGHIPPIFGKFSISHRTGPLPSETAGQRFENEIYLHYSGRKYWSEMSPYGEDNEEEAIEEVGYPSWYTLNIRSLFHVNDRISFQLSIENLMNRFYKTFASGVGAPGRSFIFSLRATL
jgi:hemoglobin/transferrin/lactoferrin receptor protein